MTYLEDHLRRVTSSPSLSAISILPKFVRHLNFPCLSNSPYNLKFLALFFLSSPDYSIAE